MRVRWLLFIWMVVAAACGDDVAPVDAGAPVSDGGARDGARDGALDAATPSDGGLELDGEVLPTEEHWFDDVTEAAGIAFVREPAEGLRAIADRMSGGVCALDVDGRAPMDLFFAVRPSATSSSRLYVGVTTAPLRYADETAARGLADVGDATGCLAFDADGDGDQDLLVTGVGSLRLFHNQGDRFVDVSARLGVTPDPFDFLASAAAGDLDDDGDLDIVVGGMLYVDPAGLAPMCGAVPCTGELSSFAPIASLLLTRRFDGTYEERAATLAPDLLRFEPTLVIAIRDFDRDGRLDVYVGNDLGSTYRDRVLSRNAAGIFGDVGEAVGVAYNRRGYGIDTMGFASGDLDGDGVLDHVATSFERDATAVFLCGGAVCEDAAVFAGTTLLEHTFRWGVALVDLDLDGDLDLVEATGQTYLDDETPTLGFDGRVAQPANLMPNLGDGRLRRVELDETDGLATARATRGITVTDLDDDGRPDVVLAPAIGAPAVLHNVHPRLGRYLRVVLRGRPPNTEATGALVKVSWPGGSAFRVKSVGEGYLGSFDSRLLFGIGGLPGSPPPPAVDVEVEWPGGTSSAIRGVAVDSEVVLSEP